MKTMPKHEAISLLALVISNIARSGTDEVELEVEWDIVKAKLKPVFGYYETDDPRDLEVGDLTFFNYRSDDGRMRIRVGEVLEISDSLLVWDFDRDAPRRSKFDGIGSIYVLEASS